MNLEQRVLFHKDLVSILEDELPAHQRVVLDELKHAIRKMCVCWPCMTHEGGTAIYLACPFCRVCALHANSIDVIAGKP